ncbi:taurine catabolism dioxygenase [Scheffersomyces stipitis CBS 6054]|uniref:Taurine catabolism dioxygenase n=1 Tax=Scheffersomyces stipitis (strain ATCC 58785 / CBS 6054 / NBRC 10063 / NRRL Y-11545) TaxID=322104 RepID=A3GG26_PICST|nr:taurine catabolism dioxygenase [Scheffersomyces stipitis CBS 6054]EAZ63446.1 taurine catabolism dioxygenase [Scheffersomyces stipitis CBS 6054]
MAPPAATSSSAPTEDDIEQTVRKLAALKPIGHRFSNNAKTGPQLEWLAKLPEPARKRFEKAGIDLSNGYPVIPKSEDIPKFVDEAFEIRNKDYPYIERGANADPEKKALFGAAKEVRHLTKHLGTEIVGLQLSDLNDKQKDELALLVAERVVVFFRNQDLSPQKQLELGEYWGQVERHPQAPHVPLPIPEGTETIAKGSGVSVIWRKFFSEFYGFPGGFRKKSITSGWHTDLVHEHQPAGITHLHNDTIPKTGGDTAWASGYAAYDKLSPALQKFLDGKTAIYRSAHQYLDRENPLKGPKYIEREHPIVRTHPATGWKYLFVNRSMTDRIVGLEPGESKVILEYLFSVYEKNLDIQVRFQWQPTNEGFGTSAIWDNRVSQHNAISDYDFDGDERHGTRVTSLAELPYFDPKSKSQREALGLSLD